MAEPLKLWQGTVQPEWIDEFEHVNIAHYLTICDQSNWAFWNLVNKPNDMTARDGHEYIIVENHVHYIAELALGTAIHVTTQLLALDDKRFVLFHHLWRDEDSALSATNEVKFLGFNLKSRRIEPWAADVKARLDAIAADHARLEAPAKAGQGISLGRR